MATHVVSFRPSDTGLTLSSASFVVFKKLSSGNPPTSPAPATFREIGYGLYSFEYTATEPVVYVVDGGSALPADVRYVYGTIAPGGSVYGVQTSLQALNDNVAQLDARVQMAMEFLSLLNKLEFGRWKIETTGPDANHMIFFDEDGTTPIAKFALKDAMGNPTFRSVMEREPVSLE